MQTTISKPQVPVFPNIRINFRPNPFLIKKEEKDPICSFLFKTLPDKGLNCLMNANIEHIICTSILSASL